MTPKELIDELQKLKDSGVSWYQMAKDLQIPYQTITNWKTRVYEPSPVYQRAIKKYLEENALGLVNNEPHFLKHDLISSNEKWLPVKDFSCYLVSSRGRVKAVRTLKTTGQTKTFILKQSVATHGYLQVGLLFNGQGRIARVHRLVAEAFLPNHDTEKYNVVNHRDSDKANNVVENLEWCTQTGNVMHGAKKRLALM